jgi:predicted transposase/invertase (TIGR01784 family)
MNTIGNNINLLTDFGFKRMFGTEPYKKNLISFLNAFIKPYFGPVTDIDYRPSEQLGLLPHEKRLVFDVYCETQKEDKVLVEMQKASQEYLNDRIIAYSARTISNSLVKGDRKYNFPPVISIVLADFTIPELKDGDDFMMHVTLKDDKNKIFSEKVTFILVDLTKFAARMDFGQFTDERQKWCYTIKNMWRLKEDDIPAEEAVFHELYEDCKISKLSDMEKQEYEKSVLEYDDVKDALDYHRRLAKAEGKAEGIAEGIEKGIVEAKQQIAVELLKNGIDIETISKATGLTKDEIEQLSDIQ